MGVWVPDGGGAGWWCIWVVVVLAGMDPVELGLDFFTTARDGEPERDPLAADDPPGEGAWFTRSTALTTPLTPF